MNSSQPFDFSIDNDEPENPTLVSTLDSAAQFGWKVELKYTEVQGWNWFSNRGHTNHFIKSCKVLDRTPMQSIFGGQSQQNLPNSNSPSTKDTVYVIMIKSVEELKELLKNK